MFKPIFTGSNFRDNCSKTGTSDNIINGKSSNAYHIADSSIYSNYSKGDLIGHAGYSDSKRPPMSYAELITMAIESSAESMLTLKEIYNWIMTHYPYFNSTKTGWQNSIRHNLSLNRCFYKVPKGEGKRGKGSYWKINYEFQNVKVNYRNRRYTTYRPMPSATIESLSQILNDKIITDNIGVNDIPYKQSYTKALLENDQKHYKQTSVFTGNLLEEEDLYNNNEYYEYVNDDKNKMNRIFSFK